MFDFTDLISFLKNPEIGKQFEIKTFYSFLKLVLITFLILFFIDVIIGLGISTPMRYFKLIPSQKEVVYSPFNIFKISFLLPIIEELIFRLPLKISKTTIAIPLSIILFLFLYKLNLYIAISLPIILFVFLFLRIKEGSDFIKKAVIFFTKYFFILFYFQALIFGFLHLTNYRLDFNFFYLFPFFIVSYVLTGCLFGYIRVRYTFGIYVCIVSHIVINSTYCFVLSH